MTIGEWEGLWCGGMVVARVCGWELWVCLFLFFVAIPQIHLLTLTDERYLLHTNNRTIRLRTVVPVVALVGACCRYGLYLSIWLGSAVMHSPAAGTTTPFVVVTSHTCTTHLPT